MKALRIILIVIGVLIGIYLIMCVMGPNQFNVSRTVTMGAPPNVVYNQINDLENWENWSPWYEMDSTMQINYGEKTEGVGASYSWTSENMGAGNLEIVETEPNSSMRTQLQFDNWDGTSYGVWNLEEEGDSTAVTWGIESSEIPFFMRGSVLLMDMDAAMGKDFEHGLSNLKEYVEEQATLPSEYRGFTIKPTTYPGITYAGIRDRVKFDNMQEFFTNSYQKIGAAAADQQVEPIGPPAALYYEWDEDSKISDMAAVFPFENAPDQVDDIEVFRVPSAKALLIDYYGPYEGLGEAHYAMDDYIKARDLTMLQPVIESYITDPGQEPDTSRWYTQIWYLVSNE